MVFDTAARVLGNRTVVTEGMSTSIAATHTRLNAQGRGSDLGRRELCTPRRSRAVSGRTGFHTDGTLEGTGETREMRARRTLKMSVLSYKDTQRNVVSIERTGDDWLETGFPTYLRTKVRTRVLLLNLCDISYLGIISNLTNLCM